MAISASPGIRPASHCAGNAMTQLSDAITAWLRAARFLAGYSPASLSTYASALRRYMRWLQRETECLTPTLGDAATPAAVTGFLAHLRELGCAPRTVNSASSVLRTFGQWLETQQWDCDVTALARAPRIPRARRGRREPARREDVLQLLAGAQRNEHPLWRLRDVALIRVLAVTGVRRSELLAMRWQDVDWERLSIRLPRTKGGGSHTVVLDEPTAQALLIYQQGLEIAGREADGDAHMWQQSNKRCVRSEGLTKLWRAILARADMGQRRDLTPHNLRHGMVTRSLEAGLPANVVMAQSGHKSIRTLAHYAHASDLETLAGVRQRFGVE